MGDQLTYKCKKCGFQTQDKDKALKHLAKERPGMHPDFLKVYLPQDMAIITSSKNKEKIEGVELFTPPKNPPCENEEQISYSIHSHIMHESNGPHRNRAFIRSLCTLGGGTPYPGANIVWITNQEIQRDPNTRKKNAYTEDGLGVYKNTKMGEILMNRPDGIYSYNSRDAHTKRPITIYIQIHNRAFYTPLWQDAEDLELHLPELSYPIRYRKLSELIRQLDKREQEKKLQKEREELARLKRIEEEERKRKEKARLEEERARTEAEKARRETEKIRLEEQARAEAEKARIEAEKARAEEERLRQIEEERLAQEAKVREAEEEAQRLAQIEEMAKEKISLIQASMRKNATLRLQHLLDRFQDQAKRSHIYDSVPVVIEGGPGTGKTTTMIQRLKFLISPDALTDYALNGETSLTEKQIEWLTDPEKLKERWIFFSPTELLLEYLKNNMKEEGLLALDDNAKTINKMLLKVRVEYGLFDPTRHLPFTAYRGVETNQPLIVEPKLIIKSFEDYIIASFNEKLSKRIETPIAGSLWSEDGLRIQEVIKKYWPLKNLEELINFLYVLSEKEASVVKKWNDSLTNKINVLAVSLKNLILSDNELLASVKNLVESWKKQTKSTSGSEDEETQAEEESFENISKLEDVDLEALIFPQLKSFIRQYALQFQEPTQALSKRNQALFDLLGTKLDEDDLSWLEIGELLVFMRDYANLCDGMEKILFSSLPQLYKAFRKSQKESKVYNVKALAKIIQKDNNKCLHPDEQYFLIGFINEILNRMAKKNLNRFNALKSSFAEAYRQNVRTVIGIDEATDYSLMEYYFMYSFRDYRLATITLCGDLMQGLNQNGISGWKVLKDILPGLEVNSLNISYRQMPPLLEVARNLYKDEIGKFPTYSSNIPAKDTDPVPQIFISDDMYEKADWISKKISEIWKDYGKEFPSIAIFVKDKATASDLVECLKETEIASSLDIVECSGNSKLEGKEMVRVFLLNEVKGMEFAAAFFYDIDTAIAGSNIKLMRRYLYVGISRAISHLYATMTSDGDEDLKKYFKEDTL